MLYIILKIIEPHLFPNQSDGIEVDVYDTFTDEDAAYNKLQEIYDYEYDDECEREQSIALSEDYFHWCNREHSAFMFGEDC